MVRRLKSMLPIWLKRVPWWLFKSPQRRLGYGYTYMVEARGAMHWLEKSALRAKELQPISICTGIKNRTDNYLDFVLPSLLKLSRPDLVEISIFDCGSEDADRLEKEIRRLWPGPLIFVKEEHPFARSYSFNRAIGQSTYPIVFACDADMSLPVDLAEQCNSFLSRRTVWFPVCFNLYEDRPASISPENGHWLPVGKGMFASYREQFENAGGFNEKYTTWGDEDWDLWFRFYQAGYLPVRNKCRGLFHHYHPSLMPPGYRPNVF